MVQVADNAVLDSKLRITASSKAAVQCVWDALRAHSGPLYGAIRGGKRHRCNGKALWQMRVTDGCAVQDQIEGLHAATKVWCHLLCFKFQTDCLGPAL